MSFFEPPPPPPEPPEPERYRQPEWIGPPSNVLGMPVPTRLVLVRTPTLAVAVVNLVAFPTGVLFHVLVRSRDREIGREMHLGRLRHLRGGHEAVPADLLRLGVLFSDGRKATNLTHPDLALADEPPAQPVLIERGGGGGNGTWSQSFWLWPLPPEGPLEFVCEWPSQGVAETRLSADTAPIHAAAQEALILWEDDASQTGFSANTWMAKATLANGRDQMSAGLGADGMIYVIGGYPRYPPPKDTEWEAERRSYVRPLGQPPSAHSDDQLPDGGT